MRRNGIAIDILSRTWWMSGFLGIVTQVHAAAEKPNILILFTDQHQADCMGFMGHPDVITPNLDRLAAHGTVFKRAYCQDGVCIPSRMAMMTGLYPRHLGILHNGDRPRLLKYVVPLQSILKQHGYDTAAFGKRHLIGEADGDWDEHRSHLAKESPG
ncbi:MAG: hypothetical protein D6820_12085, partial [Lentisphaerae bacterium]